MRDAKGSAGGAGRWVRALGLAAVLGAGATLGVDAAIGGKAGPASRPVPPPSASVATSALLPVLPELPAAVGAFEPVAPAAAGMRADRVAAAAGAVERAVERGAFPGAALAVGRNDRPVLLRGVGRTTWGGDEVDPERTVYDIASLTKVVATTTAVMLLVEDGRMELDAPVSRYLPAFRGGAKDEVTVRHLLTHTSGLPAWADLSATTPQGALREALQLRLRAAPGTRVVYSDVGFVVLWAAAQRAAGESLEHLLSRRVFGPLGMRDTRFRPGAGCTRCAPTARRSDGSAMRGVVHDPIARQFNGVAGNAGLFSTAEDLARFAAMLAGGGELDGVRVLREATVRTFTRRQRWAGTRALGWDTPDPRGHGAAGLRISPTAFGHTGFTGTSLWIDPERRTWTVLLANRTYAPRARSRIQALRRTVHDRVAVAAGG